MTDFKVGDMVVTTGVERYPDLDGIEGVVVGEMPHSANLRVRLTKDHSDYYRKDSLTVWNPINLKLMKPEKVKVGDEISFDQIEAGMKLRVVRDSTNMRQINEGVASTLDIDDSVWFTPSMQNFGGVEMLVNYYWDTVTSITVLELPKVVVDTEAVAIGTRVFVKYKSGIEAMAIKFGADGWNVVSTGTEMVKDNARMSTFLTKSYITIKEVIEP